MAGSSDLSRYMRELTLPHNNMMNDEMCVCVCVCVCVCWATSMDYDRYILSIFFTPVLYVRLIGFCTNITCVFWLNWAKWKSG